MATLDVTAPEGTVTTLPPDDVRRLVEVSAQRFSSAAARPAGRKAGLDGTAKLAARLGASERALDTAQRMLVRHLAVEGEGMAGAATATIEGPRATRLAGPGLMVRGHTNDSQNVGVALAADPVVVLVVGGEQRALHWSLLPGGPSVTARADALRFLRSLAAGGQFVFQLADKAPLPPLDAERTAWEEDEDEWRLFEDLATLEEWSGIDVPMPDTVSAEDATVIAQAASWVRARQAEAQIIDEIEFQSDEPLGDDAADELRLRRNFAVTLLGIELPLGEGVARVRVCDVRRSPRFTEEAPVYVARPERSDIRFWLDPPPGRRLPARRTQAPPAPPRGRVDSLHEGTALVRPARRSVREVVADVRRHPPAMPQVEHGTARLLDDIRGD